MPRTVAAAVLCLLLALPAAAQNAVTMIVGYPPGGSDAMVNDYLRRTRRTHAVVERVFWD